MSAPTVEEAATAGLRPQEWSPGGNRCMKATKGKTGRCHRPAHWLDVAAGERYDRYDFTHREPGSYAYKVCDGHAAAMVAAAEGHQENQT